ncbi:hypothetical protein ACFPYN_05400 [Paenisporosarcina macmurdoensis]|uniref:EAL domain-containing protein n=1 Tax=Paenisporosarcina macmurdoensis TaxID=212659 RepID=A0ABW1L592_9BACL
MHTQKNKDQQVFLNIQPQVLADSSYLELIEKEAVIDYSRFEKINDNYRQQGFRVAVDDTGTGYNSLKTKER